jgi:hypothetical protein
MRWLALVVIGCASALGATARMHSISGGEGQRPAPRLKPHEIVTVVVPATAPWTDTGIRLREGDLVEIAAWGRVRFDESTSASATPKGSGRRGGRCTLVVADAAAQSLIGNVAPAITFDGRGFEVGSAWKGSVPIRGSTAPEGRLLLGFNDEGMLCDRSGYDAWEFGGNNSGWFTAEIAITRGR